MNDLHHTERVKLLVPYIDIIIIIMYKIVWNKYIHNMSYIYIYMYI